MKRHFIYQMTGLVILLATIVVAGTTHLLRGAQGNGNDVWTMAGQDLQNSRNAVNERTIGAGNVASLATKWTFTTAGDVSATPIVTADLIFFPDWAGFLYAVDRGTGNLKWSHRIAEYDGQQGAIARVSPAVYKKTLILGDIISADLEHPGANIMAVMQETGKLMWVTKVDDHPAAIITGSPVVHGNVIYVGVSSNEEGLARNPSYKCCSFRGSVVALEATTGQILWKRYMLPDNNGTTTGYSGNAVWQSPAIDVRRGSLYVGTGNNYEVPATVEACIAGASEKDQPNCFAADDYFDSALALDLLTGRIKWSRRLQGLDIWTVGCINNQNPVACPNPSSPDYDLGGSGPNLFSNLVGFGQKSGIYWALNPANGEIVWSSVVGPGGTLGGIEWGTATDGRRIYIAVTNSSHKPYPLTSGGSTTGGAWSALDVETGRILWQTADPDQALAIGSVSVANGIMYAPSFSGNLHALDTATGKILWSFQTGGSVIDGPSIANGVLFLGSGYRKISPGTANNKVFAFAVPEDN